MASATTDLENFVHSALSRGLPRNRIESAMVEAGWPKAQANNAATQSARVDQQTSDCSRAVAAANDRRHLGGLRVQL